MLPLNAEFKRAVAYRITQKAGWRCISRARRDHPARSRRTPEEQAAEFRVLDYLAAQESAPGESLSSPRRERLRSATGVSKSILSGMVTKEVARARRCFRSSRRHAHDQDRAAQIRRRKTERQSARSVDTLAASGGRVPVETLQALDVPRTTLAHAGEAGTGRDHRGAGETLPFRAASRGHRPSHSISTQRSKPRSIGCAKPSTRESFPACFCTA